jgi:glutamine synthetase
MMRINYIDYGGIIRSEVISPEDFDDVLKKGISLPSAMMNFTAFNTLIVTNMESYEDVLLYPDTNSFTFYEDQGIVMADMFTKDGKPWEYDVRHALKRVIADSEYEFRVSFEMEFYLLKEGRPLGDSSCYEFKGYLNVIGALSEIKDVLRKNNVEVTKVLKECGSSQFEFNFSPSTPMRASDLVVVFKEVSKQVARKRDLEANFMPKPFSEVAGSGLHLNFSVWKGGENVTKRREGMSFLAGVLHHAKVLTLVSAPILNSYKRLNVFKRGVKIPGTWVPTKVAYGYNNRSTTIRLPQPRSQDEIRFEYRVPDPSVNPYLLTLSFILAGLDGVRDGLEPPRPVDGDVLFSEDYEGIPLTFRDALREFESSRLRKLLGKVGDQFLQIKKQELQDSLLYVTDWEWKMHRDI